MFLIYILISIVLGLLITFIFKIWQIVAKKDQSEQNFLFLNQKLDNLVASTNQALRETLQLISNQLKENRESTERASLAVHQQVHKFTEGITSLAENLKQVQEQVKTVSSFQQIFKAPKLRGQWGEASLQAVLAQYFPKENYKLQYFFKSGETVDAILKLPNNLILSIDSKFPLENFERYIEETDDGSKESYKKAFINDIKREIDDIAKKYILPSEGTVDCALMYIPAEGIYYEIINNMKEEEIQKYAWSKRVILVSPNTFYVTLMAINHWFRDAYITKQTQDILKELDRISNDGKKLEDDFRKLGKHLSNAKSSYDESEKRLSFMLDRVENVIGKGGRTMEEDVIEGEKVNENIKVSNFS